MLNNDGIDPKKTNIVAYIEYPYCACLLVPINILNNSIIDGIITSIDRIMVVTPQAFICFSSLLIFFIIAQVFQYSFVGWFLGKMGEKSWVGLKIQDSFLNL